MQVLSHYQVRHKIERIAYEILENNLDETAIVIAGINNNGYRFAGMIAESLKRLTPKLIILTRIRLNPAQPLEPVITDYSLDDLTDKCLIIVDDVANTGRTIFYAFKPLMEILPKKVEVAVLVDRKHKLFPIKVDYVGLSLATTLQENISANLTDTNNMNVVLS